ncbi:autophagy-related protein 101-like [Zingiber officinale]|uniref:autophagy-related protein 101-like n=1 Tax=Zingiber officinale TaxID=94328 RepID=UPI001C4C64CE|nr:autophagy-related protein 101-like [Zingiber officinale]XP_042382263.1 autophagy-related protein 101-like [Zingiber officinale]
MNCETFQLKELVVEPLEIREVLRCLLHTIVFHRALGLVRPKDIECELFEITYVQCGDHELDKKIEEKTDQLIAWVEKHPNKKSQICLSFYEVKNKHASWFGNRTERFYWEQWYINLHVLNPKSHTKPHNSKAPLSTGENTSEEGSSRRTALESSLREVLFQIIRFVNEKKDHIPPVQNSEIISFPYEISTPSASDSSFGWHADVLKRMLQTGHPSMLS